MNTNIKQHDESDCAAACIASIARHFGKAVPIAVIRESSGTSPAGTTLKGIIDSCRELGFRARAFKSDAKDLAPLAKMREPVILHLVNPRGDLHFVVLYGMSRRKAVVMDPATGSRRKILLCELKEQWTGYVVTMVPDEESDKQWGSRTKPSPLLRSFKLIDFKEYTAMLVSSLVYIVAGISTALFLQHIIDRVLPLGDPEELWRVGSLMAAIMLCTLFLGYGRVIYALRLSLKLDGKMTLGYISHLFKLPTGFFGRRGAGELNSRIGDVAKVRNFLTEGIPDIATSILILAASFALMFTNHWRLALMMLSFIPLYLFLYAVAKHVNKKANRDIIESGAAFEEKIVESITAVKVIKYFGEEDAFLHGIRRQYYDLAGKMLRGGKYLGIFASWADAFSKAMTLVLLTVGSLYIFGGELSVGELVSFYSLTAYFSTPLGKLVNISEQYSEAQISAERLSDISDMEAESLGSLEFELDPTADILIENIEFSYPGSPLLLKNFSLSIPAGKITALQGESGCGKSSVAALLMRDYAPQSGCITLGCVPIGTIDLSLWRRFISIVPQDAPLMGGTILENITCQDPEPNIALISQILTDLGLLDFIKSLPLGLMTRIGSLGATLSGGQKQRIALARALYHNPQTIILDEATSSLDETSEKFILRKLQSLRDEGRTILMITHKSDNAKIADKVVNMDARS